MDEKKWASEWTRLSFIFSGKLNTLFYICMSKSYRWICYPNQIQVKKGFHPEYWRMLERSFIFHLVIFPRKVRMSGNNFLNSFIHLHIAFEVVSVGNVALCNLLHNRGKLTNLFCIILSCFAFFTQNKMNMHTPWISYLCLHVQFIGATAYT